MNVGAGVVDTPVVLFAGLVRFRLKAASGVTDTAAVGALSPPAFVAERALRRIAEGQSEVWCSTRLIVRDSDNLIVGGCGFKGEPRDGRVEINYGVAPGTRRQGAATEAVSALLHFAFSNGAIEVLAEIAIENRASARTVEKLGFKSVATRVAEDGVTVVQWVLTGAEFTRLRATTPDEQAHLLSLIARHLAS